MGSRIFLTDVVAEAVSMTSFISNSLQSHFTATRLEIVRSDLNFGKFSGGSCTLIESRLADVTVHSTLFSLTDAAMLEIRDSAINGIKGVGGNTLLTSVGSRTVLKRTNVSDISSARTTPLSSVKGGSLELNGSSVYQFRN
jgi:hypothetical protein